MTISLPNAQEIDQYSVVEPPRRERGAELPRVVDDEAVCLVRTPATGQATYWSRGDVDTHRLYTEQQGLGDVSVSITQASLAPALRACRVLRQRLLQHGVQTTATGLMLLHPQRPAQLVLPTRP